MRIISNPIMELKIANAHICIDPFVLQRTILPNIKTVKILMTDL